MLGKILTKMFVGHKNKIRHTQSNHLHCGFDFSAFSSSYHNLFAKENKSVNSYYYLPYKYGNYPPN